MQQVTFILKQCWTLLENQSILHISKSSKTRSSHFWAPSCKTALLETPLSYNYAIIFTTGAAKYENIK